MQRGKFGDFQGGIFWGNSVVKGRGRLSCGGSFATRTAKDTRTGEKVLILPETDAFADANYKTDLREVAEKNGASVKAANTILKILATTPKRWWEFWK
jgi:hypothetical protein